MNSQKYFLAFIVAFLFSLATGYGDDPKLCVKALEEDDVACRSEPHPLSRRIFPCPARDQILRSKGILRENLPQLFQTLEEHEMVKLALQTVISASTLNPMEKAVYWEELTSVIQKQIGAPVSQSFRGLKEETIAYIFQGRKRFAEGKVYVLILLENGEIYTGLTLPIEDIALWVGSLDQLKLIPPP